MNQTRPLIALVGVMLVAMTGFGVFLPVFPALALSTGAGPTTITWALGAYSLGQLISAPVWGRLSDRIGRKPVLVWGLTLTGASYLALAFAETIWQMGAARLAAGLMAGNAGAAFAAAADLADDRTRARNMGFLGAAVGFGFIAGPAIGGMLAGDAPTRADFMRICFVSGGFAIAAAMLCLAWLPETRKQGVLQQRDEPLRLWTAPRAVQALLGASLMIITAQALLESTFGIWAHDVLDWTPHNVGWALAGVGLVSALVQGGGAGAAARRLGDLGLVRLGAITLAIGFGALAVANASALAIAAVAIVALGVALAQPGLQSLAAEAGGAGGKGAALGLNQSAGALGRVLGPALSGALFEHMGSHTPYMLAAGLALCALALSVMPFFGRDLSRSPT